MQCPNDGAVLTMSERSGVEIDYCPTCRGVWLDRGELDKLIERSLQHTTPPQQTAPPQYGSGGYEQPRPAPQAPYRKRKESWLSELFD